MGYQGAVGARPPGTAGARTTDGEVLGLCRRRWLPPWRYKEAAITGTRQPAASGASRLIYCITCLLQSSRRSLLGGWVPPTGRLRSCRWVEMEWARLQTSFQAVGCSVLNHAESRTWAPRGSWHGQPAEWYLVNSVPCFARPDACLPASLSLPHPRMTRISCGTSWRWRHRAAPPLRRAWRRRMSTSARCSES